MTKVKAVLLAAFLLLVGCAGQGGEQGQAVSALAHEGNVMYGLFGPGPMMYSGIRQRPTYSHRGEENTTSTSFRTLTNERQNLGDDQSLIHQIIHDQFGFEMGMVVIAGSHAYVKVTPPPELDAQQKKAEMTKLKEALQQQIPRYQVHIRE
ncbi:hypothetical protein [Halalkalibacter oceani]|uniref:Uncharacterized protein n=1 Tax=Halalkalibacter oceani TaxID=1653776 RepID=A0A9X2INY3_9BACI|nr:hypothetical protein [Halalkalibacter oceani]MCM3714261.1 hypothetical protein [Halalkalibacter oceani]